MANSTPFHRLPSALSLSSLPHLMPYSGLPSSPRPYCYHTWGIVDILMALLVKSSRACAVAWESAAFDHVTPSWPLAGTTVSPSILSRFDSSTATDIKRTANIRWQMLQVCATANSCQHMSRTSRATPHPRSHIAGLALLYIGGLDPYWYVLHPSLVARTSI